MTDQEKFRNSFSGLHAAPETLTEVLEMAEKKNGIFHWRYSRKLIMVSLAVALIFSLGIGAYASGIIQKIFGWGENMEITITEEGTEVVLHTEQLTEPVQVENGKVIFLVNGENLDITQELNEEKAFVYSYRDEEGNSHFWILGLLGSDLESYAYGEFIQDTAGKWVGGYTARVNIQPDGKTVDWMDNAKAELGIPW